MIVTDIKMWSEKGKLYIRVKKKAGLFYIELPGGYQLDFLADTFKRDNKDGRAYYFVGVKPYQDRKLI